MPSYDGRATDELVEALATMPSSWAQSHLWLFIQQLKQELELRNRGYRHALLETFAASLVEDLGSEVDWFPNLLNNKATSEEIAEEWYALGHADGEEGMPPEPHSHASQWAELP